MKKRLLMTSGQCLLMSFLFLNGRAQTVNANLEEAKKAIAASNELYFQALAKGDSTLMIDRYTKDCWIMMPNMPTLCGIEAPHQIYNIAYNKVGLRNGRFITIDVFGDAVEYVTEVGFFQTYSANNKLFDNGKFQVLWKKTPVGWKMFRESFSSDRGKN
jgi:ketosteroid isomerase-like protein